MLVAYPPIKPYQQHLIQLDEHHRLYAEESGNPKGIPVLFIHGGPGEGSSSEDRRFFDPEAYRIIVYDQRGCGRSTPHATLENNTTALLLKDIEVLREELNIEAWMIFGSAWGAALGVLYAAQHPTHVLGLILHSIFLARQQDIESTVDAHKTTASCFPEYWDELMQLIDGHTLPAHEILSHYHALLLSENEIERMAAAKAWTTYHARCSTFEPCRRVQAVLSEPHIALALARITCHYFIHHCFIDEGRVIEAAKAMGSLPGMIVHGRYDMLCPLKNAWALHHAWPHSEFHIVREAGHSPREPATMDALVRATRAMAKRLHSAS